MPLLTVVDGFLSEASFRALYRNAHALRGGRSVYGKLQHQPFLAPLLQVALGYFAPLDTLVPQQALLRFEGETGLLHHDLNHRADRQYSLIYYLEAPTRGGEIVFPLLDADGKKTHNPVTEACAQLAKQEQYYTEDPGLEDYIIAHREHMRTISPAPNTAIFFASRAPELWHFVCPVLDGRRTCIVVFYHAP